MAGNILQHLMCKKKHTHNFKNVLQGTLITDQPTNPFTLITSLCSSLYYLAIRNTLPFLKNTVMWDPQDNPQVNDSPQGITELSKAVIHSVIVYYSKRVQSKISNKHCCKSQSVGGTRCKLLTVLSQWHNADRAQFSQQRCLSIQMSIGKL